MLYRDFVVVCVLVLLKPLPGETLSSAVGSGILGEGCRGIIGSLVPGRALECRPDEGYKGLGLDNMFFEILD